MNNNQLRVARDKKIQAIKVSNAAIAYQAMKEGDVLTALAYSNRKESKQTVKTIAS